MTHLLAAVDELYASSTSEMTIAEWFAARGIPQDEVALVSDVLIKSAIHVSGGDVGSFLAAIALVGMQIGWMAHAASLGEVEEAA